MPTALFLGRAAARTTRRRLPVTVTLIVAVLVAIAFLADHPVTYAAAAVSATLVPAWRLRVRVLLLGYAVLALAVTGGLPELVRLFGVATGLVLGAVVTIAARRLLDARPAHGRSRSTIPQRHLERQLVRDRLRAVGSTNRLAWMTTWPQNRWFHSTGAAGYLAHRVHAGVAIGLCDPVAVDEYGRGLLLHEFATRAGRRGLVPCVFAATVETAASAVAMGWRVLPVGEEAVVDLPGLAFQGRAWQDVRTALNHAARRGITVETGRLDELPDGIRLQVAEISCGWTSARRLPELGFTLGGLDEAADPEVVVSVAIDRAGVVHGVTSWLPSHRPSDGTVEGWTLDVMRRRQGSDAFRPVMELLIAMSLLRFRDEGCAWASLSASPLAPTSRVDDVSGRSAGLELVVQRLATRLEPLYGFRSLHAFKAKFSPRFEPLYLVYPDKVALPRIMVALARAYLPHARLRDIAALWSDRHPEERPARDQASMARVTSALSTAAASSAPSTET